MLLGQLLKSVNKKYRKIDVKGISFNSSNVKKKHLFFAIEGSRTSGTKFVNEAIMKGASAIISRKKIKYKNCKIPIILVSDVRKSLAVACSNFYREKPNNLIAVTGTNGKSSVAHFFYQIFNLNRIDSASIGTLGVLSKKYKKKTNLTSTDSLQLNKNLSILSKNKIKNVILEASSHGLKQKRLDNLNIKTGIFTNLSHDHLDYHKNMKSYFNSKLYLFKNLLSKNSKIITDEDNKEFKFIKKIAKKRKMKIITIGTKTGNLKITNVNYRRKNQIVNFSINSKNFTLEIPLIGYFQLKNLFMAVLAASLSSRLSINKIASQLHKIKPVPGRLECVESLNHNSNIIVDFAHTPEALEQSLIALKKQFKNEIIIVFGCGGERDKEKRFVMGKIASKYCRKIFITDDNPRNENPKKIRDEVIKGCNKSAVSIGSRRIAIKKAIEELKFNETLLVAGKGHEETQNYGKKVINFSDKKLIKKIVNKKKKYKRKNDYKSFILKKTFHKKNINNINYNGVSINTKTLKKNNLFFAIRGKKMDGHNFAKKAIKKGAIRLIVSKKIKKISKNKIIKVKNTFSSLNNLAKITRNHSSASIIGITGSVGKTTLKNLLSFSLTNYGKVYKSPHSYNNRFGVPLSISNLNSNTDYGVFEIGMDKKGEINNLSKIVKPEIAVITNIAGAHFKNFRTLKDIARAKGEIIYNITKGGNLILNRDDKFFNFLSNIAKENKIKITAFSMKKKSDICLSSIIKKKSYSKLKININNKPFYFNIKHSTNNFIQNILACISVMSVLNLNLKKMETIFLDFKIPEGRGDIITVKKFNKQFKFIDESYNANLLSMTSAINNMNYYKFIKNKRRIAFLGDMLELGSKTKKMHKALSKVINKSKIDKVFVCGKYIKETFKGLKSNKKGKVFANINEANDYFSKILTNNDLLMVKGSNATGLNQFSKNIKKGQISAI
tara:strand:- start:2640 stop:5492 length:2853 start_codon:yes stop_codon:yes gene_type:complete